MCKKDDRAGGSLCTAVILLRLPFSMAYNDALYRYLICAMQQHLMKSHPRELF